MYSKNISKKLFSQNILLGESSIEIRNLINKFSIDKIKPIAREIDKTDRFPKNSFQKWGNLVF